MSTGEAKAWVVVCWGGGCHDDQYCYPVRVFSDPDRAEEWAKAATAHADRVFDKLLSLTGSSGFSHHERPLWSRAWETIQDRHLYDPRLSWEVDVRWGDRPEYEAHEVPAE